jgi:hypothetical protein
METYHDDLDHVFCKDPMASERVEEIQVDDDVVNEGGLPLLQHTFLEVVHGWK